MIPGAIQFVLAAFVAAAGVWDLTTRRIPNWLTVPAALLGIALQAWYGGWRGAAAALLGMGLGLAIFLLLYLAGGMGAGDVKMFAAVGALLGPQRLVTVFVLTGLLGGVAALALSLARGRLRQVLANTGGLLVSFGTLRWREMRQKSSLNQPGALRLPYGAVIAAATLLWLFL